VSLIPKLDQLPEAIMKSYRKELWFNINKRRQFVNITRDVENALKESEIKEGLVLINAMHITASVFLEGCQPENRPNLRHSS
jgi:thiamine phosphate synthase YjbQ (UPF0047 family)